MSDIDSLLARFYVEVRKVDGQYYSKVSLNSLRAALQRYLQNPPWNVTYSILKDGAFLHSNNVLKGLFKTLTEMGVSTTKHYKAIEQGDIQKLVETGVIGMHNPRSLQNLVWLSISLHFGKRGREGYRSMTKDTFIRGMDDSGSIYYEYAVCESQKNHSGGTIASTYKPQGRMYAQPGDPICPVAAFDKYLSLLHPDLPWLWQRPIEKFHPEKLQWYCKMVLGHNTLDTMMKNMCKAAGLSQIYTNHCTRATVSKTLGDASFDRSDIIKITGHRDTRSLDPYIGEASSSKKRALSDTIAGLTCQTKPQGNRNMKQNNLTDRIDLSDHTDPIGQHNHANEVILQINESEVSVTEKQEFMDDNKLQVEMMKMAE